MTIINKFHLNIREVRVYQGDKLIGHSVLTKAVAITKGRDGFVTASRFVLPEIRISAPNIEEGKMHSVAEEYPRGSWIPEILWGKVNEHWEEIANTKFQDVMSNVMSPRLVNNLGRNRLVQFGDILRMTKIEMLKLREISDRSIMAIQETLGKLILERKY